MDTEYFPQIVCVIASIPEEGMHLQAYASGQQGEIYPNGNSQHLLTFRTSDDKQINVVFHLEDQQVEIPVAELLRAVEMAKSEVHSEQYYDR